ncbi:unnamed protein product [Urochloa humidicola]
MAACSARCTMTTSRPGAHLCYDGCICILPWLAICKTGTVARSAAELPTDDPEYEKWKAKGKVGRRQRRCITPWRGNRC